MEQSESVERITVVLGDDFDLPTRIRASSARSDTIPDSSEWKAMAEMIPSAPGPAYIPEGY